MSALFADTGWFEVTLYLYDTPASLISISSPTFSELRSHSTASHGGGLVPFLHAFAPESTWRALRCWWCSRSTFF